MARIEVVFPQTPVVLPVIHVTNPDQAVRNVRIARRAGADGAFLINHSINHQDLLSCHQYVHSLNTDWWLGVNCLDLEPQEVLGLVDSSVAGVWTDNAGIDENADQQSQADLALQVRDEAGWSGLYFGGVAFKYQREVEDLAGAVHIASEYMDVVTTSGPGTGLSADPGKIKTMKDALGDTPLAVASGITPENVHDYLGWVDCFLVATGISSTFEDLDPGRTKLLIQKVREFREC